MDTPLLQRHRGGLAAAAVALAAVLPFAGTLGHGFALDDGSEVVRNDHVHSLAQAPRLFAEGAWEGAGDVNPIYRPLTSLTYALNHAVGGLDPAGYHLVNVLLHALCALLVLALGRRLGASLLAATAAALLFAVHPVHVEVVANVAGRKDALATVFIIATLLAHRTALGRGGARLPLPWLAFAAALLSKETGAVALGILAVWDLVVEPERWRAGRGRVLLLYAGYTVLLGLYLLARRAAVGSLGVPVAFIPFVENPLPHLPTATRLLTAVAVLGRGLWLLVWPRSLSPDYSWNAIPPVTSPLDPAFLASLVVLVAMVAAAALWRRTRPALTFLILWYAGAVFPTSNLLIPVGTVFGERLLYLPSVAFCLAVGLLLQGLLARKVAWPRLAGVAVLLLLSWRTVAYASAWRDEVSLFTAAVEAQPGSAKAHELLGASFMAEDRAEEGARQLELAVQALSALPEPPQAQRVKLGVAYERLGRLDEAEVVYQQVLRQAPGFADATWRLGVVRWRQGRRDEAARLWEQAVAEQPDHARAMADLGLALQERGDLAGAEALFERAARVDPRTAGPWLSLGYLYASRGDLPRARQAWLRFLELARDGVFPGQRERVEQLLRETDPGRRGSRP
jgi:tetratricopeptide (TPR) repeat protein